MADNSLIFHYFSHQRFLFKTFFFIPTTLALITTLVILVYISITSHFFFAHHHHHHHHRHQQQFARFVYPKHPPSPPHNVSNDTHLFLDLPRGGGGSASVSQRSARDHWGSSGKYMNNNEVFHDRDIFLEDYKQMNRSFRIYVYPHKQNEPFANVLLPVNFEPSGNYASESYFKRVLMQSHFITKNPNEADLFFLPFSIARLRHDPRIGVEGIQHFIQHYILNISQKYPYWNRTGGADHFYVACHSVGRSAMDKAWTVKLNAIQVVCSSSYYLSSYIPHKDASLPQIWPRHIDPPNLASSKRKKLAFFAGSINSPVREKLIQYWRNDSEIFAHFGRVKTSYADELLGSKFCLHVKGFEVNTARIADSLYYGCVPVIIANHYDLPFADILNWKSFSVVVATLDIPLLKKILKEISSDRYLLLQSNVMKVRKHFQWHLFPIDYDAFYMVLYELWLRRSSLGLRVQLSSSFDSY
ncbi:probable glycosyltransferase At5g03795 [Mangifera indica]|uniref:probable glycosyltransferase At5g03795 n=1 Tax=Mangifera indica TaxID=29780 RepID=UPI001CFC1DB7|nr:probable glycosyltransferase At5g03795 [Mangifera indica]